MSFHFQFAPPLDCQHAAHPWARTASCSLVTLEGLSEFVFMSQCTVSQAANEPGRLLCSGPASLRHPGFYDFTLECWRRLYTTSRSGVDLAILEECEAKEECDGSTFLWPAALVLARELEEGAWLRHLVLDGNIVELGSGAGLPSMVAAVSGARRVLATEGSQHALTFLSRNCALNNVNVSVRKLWWGNICDSQALGESF